MVTGVGWAQNPSPGGTAAAPFAFRAAAETTYDVTASLAGTAASRGGAPPAGRGTLSAGGRRPRRIRNGPICAPQAMRQNVRFARNDSVRAIAPEKTAMCAQESSIRLAGPPSLQATPKRA